MRRVIPILFVLLLSAPFLGTYSWLNLEKYNVRKSIKHKIIDGIDDNLLIHMAFAKSDTAIKLEWKHKKEFFYNGSMYDIINRTYTKDSVKYALWWDNEETQLNKKLDQLTKNFIQGSSEKKSKSNYFDFVVKQLICDNNKDLSTIPHDENEKSVSGWIYLESKPLKHTKVDSPPPKFIIQNA